MLNRRITLSLTAAILAGVALTGCTVQDFTVGVGEQTYGPGNTATPTSEATPTGAPTPTVSTGDFQGLDALSIAEPDDRGDYYRTQDFGAAWSYDFDGNFCDTRDDILARDMTDVTYTDPSDQCQVQTGTLNDPYTGKVIDFTRGVGTSMAVQIDHLIPLKYVWTHGARDWTQEKREQIANDPENLYAVDGPTNGSKSDRGPSEFMPPNEAFHCTYATGFVKVATKYQLSITSADHDALQTALATCKA